MSSDELLTARDVAVRLGVSPDTVLQWTRAGKLRAIRLPSRALRYRAAEFDRTLDAWTERPVLSVVPPTKEET